MIGFCLHRRIVDTAIPIIALGLLGLTLCAVTAGGALAQAKDACSAIDLSKPPSKPVEIRYGLTRRRGATLGTAVGRQVRLPQQRQVLRSQGNAVPAHGPDGCVSGRPAGCGDDQPARPDHRRSRGNGRAGRRVAGAGQQGRQ